MRWGAFVGLAAATACAARLLACAPRDDGARGDAVDAAFDPDAVTVEPSGFLFRGPCNSVASAEVVITNHTPVTVTWGFGVAPPSGTLAPGESVTVTRTHAVPSSRVTIVEGFGDLIVNGQQGRPVGYEAVAVSGPEMRFDDSVHDFGSDAGSFEAALVNLGDGPIHVRLEGATGRFSVTPSEATVDKGATFRPTVSYDPTLDGGGRVTVSAVAVDGPALCYTPTLELLAP